MFKGLSWYTLQLKTRPIITKSITSSVMMMSGDQLQQYIERSDHKDQQLDLIRSARMGAFGAFFVGPVLHWWYGRLETMFPSGTAYSTMKKMVVDQSIAAPASTACFFYIVGALSGHNVPQINERMRQKFGSTMLVNYAIWPLAISVNFAAVPVHFQPLFSNSIGLVYNAFLSKAQHS